MHCILHIGPPKTGSTSIQFFLREARDSLAADGVFVPRAHEANMSEFGLIVARRVRRNRAARRRNFTADNAEERRAALRDWLGGQMAEARAAGRERCVISTESLASLRAPEIAELRDWLAGWCDGFTMIAVLRRQDLQAQSLYRNQVRFNGATHRNPLRPHKMMRYDRLLDRWAGELGETAVRPLLLPDSVDEPRDLMEDFCAAAGIDPRHVPATAREARQNEAIDARALELLRRLNRRAPPVGDGSVTPGRARLEALLAAPFARPRRMSPARDAAETFAARFAAPNEAVRARWFPDRTTLFSADFSRYPKKARRPGPDAAFFMELAERMARDTH